MKPDPLRSARNKYGRALHHLKALDAEVRSFVESEVERLATKYDDQVGEKARKPFIPSWLGVGDAWVPQSVLDEIQISRELPARFSLIIGDFLVNLRAALDHAVNGVAGDHAGEYTKFPILKWREGRGWGKWSSVLTADLVGVPTPLQACIKRMQPDRGHRRGKRLTLLNDLCNFDKHKVLSVMTALTYRALPPGGNGIGESMGYVHGVLGDKAEVRVTFFGPYREPKVEGGSPYDIILAKGYQGAPVAMRLDLTVLADEVGTILAEIGHAAKQPPQP